MLGGYPLSTCKLPQKEGKSLQSKGEWMDNESNTEALERYQKRFCNAGVGSL